MMEGGTLTRRRLRRTALLSAGLLMMAACVSLPAESWSAEVQVTKPILVRAIVQSAKQLTPIMEAQDLVAVYEVKLEIQQVLAGASEWSMESDAITIKLAASNPGYFGRGAELVVLLDPSQSSASKASYWRRFTRFACIETAQVDKSRLQLEDRQAVVVGTDTCLIYGP